uniref:Uncharacterized protein n=1 Tax=Anguilla anguilla TaxID=7936 RepID=A0A0E9S9N1_ANGAN
MPWGLFDQREDSPLLAHQHYLQQQLSFPRQSPIPSTNQAN